ncbi:MULTISPECIES: hypothetical protein [Maricaulis]|jgi:hypothetical protein|uniref:hypothetical protein n=1 Tax=Maricaulis TaxID=74317 RepID=UPI0025BC7218|nr:hypothetical protein [Maricaulis sp.]BDX00273.1 hypothetical protein MACH15_20250 [Maricaulis maris]
MGQSRPHIDRLEDSVLQLRFDSDADWADLLTGVEGLSERNLSGSPLNYLLEFAGRVTFSNQGRAENIAEFFIQFIPARSAVAIVRPGDLADTPGAAVFRTRLAEAGFLTCCFDNSEAARFWLALHPPHCGSSASPCGPDCDRALSSDCPPIQYG